MDKIKFGHLMAYLGHLSIGRTFTLNEVYDIHQTIVDGMQLGYDDRLMSDMLAAMKSGRKIDAIKAHRAMSGFGLKESKDFIEQHWITQYVPPSND